MKDFLLWTCPRLNLEHDMNLFHIYFICDAPSGPRTAGFGDQSVRTSLRFLFLFCLDRPVLVRGSLIRFIICSQEYHINASIKKYTSHAYPRNIWWTTVAFILRFPFCWQNLSWQIIFRPWPSWLGQFRRFYKFK